MVPRSLLVLVLVAVAGSAAAGVASAESDPSPVALVGAASPVTPVLSARRAPSLLAAPVADRRLAVLLDELLGRQPGSVCLTVSDRGRVLYEHLPEAPLIPASVEKLLTATAALELLGPGHRFRTSVVAAAAPVGGVIEGDAWLVGGGDPLLATAEYGARFENQPQVLTPVEGLADALVAAGVTAISGSLLGDGARYDDDRYPDAWPARFVDQDQSGPLSALSVNDGWEAFPADPEATEPDETPAADPEALATAVIGGLLTERGVSVGATGAAVAPAGVVEIAAIESPPLTEVVGQMLRESDNQTAELLLKELALAVGRPPTTAEGAAVVLETVTRLGLPVGGAVVADGSGLATDDLVSCRLVQAILDRDTPSGPIGTGLAVAGQTGTLARRFLDSPVTGRLRAKTGTLNQVTALAGFVDTLPGSTLTFALIVNLVPEETVDAEDLARQEELGALLATYPEGAPLDSLGPRPLPGAS